MAGKVRPLNLQLGIPPVKRLFSVLFILLLSGCATLQVQPVIPETVEMFRPYPAGQVMEKSVGEELLGYNFLLKAKKYPGFEAIEDFQPPAFAFGQRLPAIVQGSEWVAIAKLDGGGYLCKNRNEKYSATIPVDFGKSVKSDWEVCLLVDAAGAPYGTAVCGTNETRASVWPQKMKNFLRPKQMIEVDKKEWREARIIYAGKTRDAIRFIYQETALRDLEFTFDLTESGTVAVKDIAFEIIEATNTSIKYKILTRPEELKTRIERQLNGNGAAGQF